MDIIGNIKFIGETVDVGTSGFQKRDVVVTTEDQYPQHILVQFVQDKCNLPSGFKIGDNVRIDINLRGREWTNPQGEVVYFNTIQGWKITSIQPVHQHPGGTSQEQAHQQQKPAAQNTQQQASFDEDPDDLPF